MKNADQKGVRITRVILADFSVELRLATDFHEARRR